MPPFPVHTDHSSESPVALDRFNQHSTGWKRCTTIGNFSAFRCLINRSHWSRQAIPRHHSTHSYSVALLCHLAIPIITASQQTNVHMIGHLPVSHTVRTVP